VGGGSCTESTAGAKKPGRGVATRAGPSATVWLNTYDDPNITRAVSEYNPNLLSTGSGSAPHPRGTLTLSFARRRL
jgi:hypothetical protein